jgi:mono/diheme cytochrome c family protein
MASMRTLRFLAAPAAALVLSSCGGGGSSADVHPGETPPVSGGGPNSFLLFPNPQVQPDGTQETNSAAYADAYYRAVDPGVTRDTFAKWKAANGFDTGTGQQVSVVFGDKRDLGYGRRMTFRRNDDGTAAAYVENYVIQAGPGYSYSSANLDAAIQRDTRWIVGISALEFSPGPGGGVAFAKFYNFGADGSRELLADVDGRGNKAMPGPCITCHGGRGDPLTPPGANGEPLFAKVESAPSGQRGDTLAHLQPLEPDQFDFSASPGFTRAEQEAAIKSINRMVLCTYPLPKPSTAPEDACRRAARSGEWGATSAEVIKSGYGGDGLPDASFSPSIPAGWAGHEALYTDVVVPSCRACHLVRGTAGQSDIDFDSFAKFAASADQVRPHVYDRGDMPLAKIVYDAFWNDATRPSELADFLAANGADTRDASGAVKRPGRPVADPGPDRVALPGTVALSADNSLFANAYAWSLASGPDGAALAGAGTSHASLTAPVPGTYTLQLVAMQGAAQSDPATLHVVVVPSLHPAPADIRFADIKAALQASNRCSGCHSAAFRGPRPPVFFADEDRNGDGSIDAADEDALYAVVRGEVNFTDVAASPLLRKPSGHHHFAGKIAGFDATAAPGDPSRELYDLFLGWILDGAPR